jgi:hypothetical protein
MTGLAIGTEYNAQTTHSGILAIVMVCEMSICNIFGLILNPITTNVVKMVQIHT